MNFIVYSLYTKNTPYESMAERLRASLEEHKIEHYIQGVENKGHWIKNVNLKPKNIQAFIKESKRPILWVDADAEFLRFPTLISSICKNNYDIGCHRMERYTCVVSSGTVFYNFNKNVLDFIDRWNDECDKNIENKRFAWSYPHSTCKVSMEQHVFGQMIDSELEKKKGLRIYNLPADYYAIVSNDNKTLISSESYDNPAVKHYQASRVCKKSM